MKPKEKPQNEKTTLNIGETTYLISSDKTAEIFEDFKEDYLEENSQHALEAAPDYLEELIEMGCTPVFTLPKEYLEEFKKHGLKPRQTWIKDSPTGKNVTGTIGRPPYKLGEGERYIIILRDPNKFRQYSLQPKLTPFLKGKRSHHLFQGVVATLKQIPPSELIVIDPETEEIVYPENSKEVASIRSKVLKAIEDAA